MLLPDTDEKGALFIAEALQACVAALELVHDSSEAGKHVTVSAGTATVQVTPFDKAADLIHAADQALYEAKEKGRNRVEARHEHQRS